VTLTHLLLFVILLAVAPRLRKFVGGIVAWAIFLAIIAFLLWGLWWAVQTPANAGYAIRTVGMIVGGFMLLGVLINGAEAIWKALYLRLNGNVVHTVAACVLLVGGVFAVIWGLAAIASAAHC
jgi:hypothetical protein